ncbi:MAG: RnfABCDGE type electron transport complex subunit D [Phycisphaerae bacterium]|nr:RnfABCDGE type electron transport complex subunit D [Phycisphaerae bacterium]
MVALILVSYIAGGAVEVAFAVMRKETINEGFLVTGMLFPLVMPPTVPLWMAAIGVAFGVFVGKELFGGTGRNIFNPAILGRCFLFLAYPDAMASRWIAPGSGPTGRMLEFVSANDVQAMTEATPLALAKQGELTSIWDMFIGAIPGSIGETSALAIILGGMFLLITRVASWRTVVSTIGSAAIVAGILHINNPDKCAPVLWSLFAGGLMFGAFFMTTDPVSSPSTNVGKYIYGGIIGTMTILVRNFGGYAEGMMFAILFGNIVAPIIDEMVVTVQIRRLANEG